ncbi:MAG: hypothetical protein IKG34_04980 [Solobacterium sp.]|nr:hypothetical protein [Solobacterium sp.]
MLKKLQSLLFEEEEIEEEETVEEPEPQPEPVRKRRKETRPEPAETEQVQAETKTTMQRIDVTQPLQTIGSAVPAANESVFKPAEPEKPKGLGLTVDELEGTAKQQAQPEPAKPAAPVPAKPSRQRKSGYDFSPVISPIFGVDETDMNAVKATVGSRRGKKDDENVSKVISPIYGAAKEEESPLASTPKPSATMKPVQRAEESVFNAPQSAAPAAAAADDDVPEFSLDDILRVGDEQYAKDNRMVMQSLFPDLDGSDEDVPDETTVVDSRNVTPYGTIERKN